MGFIISTLIIGIILYFLFRRKGGKLSVGQKRRVTDTEYKGETGGIAWVGTSSYQHKKPGQRYSSSFRYFKWRTGSVPLTGKFLMILSLPNKMKLQAPQPAKGFIGNMVNKLAEVMLDMYVGSFFGDQYKHLINISDGHIIKRTEEDDFFILTNDVILSEKFLTQTEATIRKWKTQNSGFASEKIVDAFGVLFAPEEMIFSIQTSLDTEEEVQHLASFAAALAVSMSTIHSES